MNGIAKERGARKAKRSRVPTRPCLIASSDCHHAQRFGSKVPAVLAISRVWMLDGWGYTFTTVC
jgi:hypothetical protein